MGLVSAAVDTELQCRLGSRTRAHFYQPPFRISRRKSSKVGVRRTHMVRLGVSKKKKSPRATELSQLKKELKRVTEQLEFRDRELEQRNAELREALEHQSATAEVFGIISRSPTDVQPVLDAIVESAARVCGIDDVTLRLREGDSLVSRARISPIPVVTSLEKISIDDPRYRWM